MVLAGLTLVRLDLALLIVPFYLPFFAAPKHVGHWEFSPSEILILLNAGAGAALVALGRLEVGWSRIIGWKFLLPAGLLAIGAAVSTAVAADRHVALEWLRWTILEPLFYVGMLLAFLRENRHWTLLALSAVAGGVVAGCIGIGQSLVATGGPTLPVVHVHLQQAKGAYGSPDNLGLLYDRLVPLWLALGLAALTVTKRAGWLMAGAVILLALFLTYSRGAWVAVALAALLLLAVTNSKGKWLALGALIVAVLLVAAAGPRITHTLASGHAGTASKRLVIWGAAVRMVRDHPLLGIGPDNFQHYYAPTRKQDRWQSECTPGLGYVGTNAAGEPCLSHPHNVILDFWLSTGIVGLVAFLWLQGVFWRLALFGRHLSDPLALGAAAAMAASLVHGLVDNSYFLPDLAVLFWILCALVSRPRPEPERA
jgi:O-antigen ligase